MLLWRLSIKRFADSFDGGYGKFYDGRWNSKGHPVTYCSTSPSLCVLEKLVHIEDIRLLPPLVMVCYEVPDNIVCEQITLEALPGNWRRNETWTQNYGDVWHETNKTAIIIVPSVIMPIQASPDKNAVINNNNVEAQRITILEAYEFHLDERLL